mgnify:CR=1 FL=1
MNTMLTAAKAAKIQISTLTTEQKNAALLAMADALEAMRAPAMEMQGNLLTAAAGAGSSPGTSSYTHNYGGFTVNVYGYQGDNVKLLAAQVAQELNRQIMSAQRAGGY